MSDLTEFLLARIAEDEAGAVAAQRRIASWAKADVGPWITARQIAEQVGPGAVLDAFIARHDPARVLAECQAKRRIVEWHGERDDCCEERYGPLILDAESEWSAGTDSLGQLSMRQSIGTQRFIGCVTLMHLASVYSDHPNYDEAWRA